MNKSIKTLMWKSTLLSTAVAILLVLPIFSKSVNTVKADSSCTPNYGGGQTCTEEKDFELEKKVRFKGKGDFVSKLKGAEVGDTVEFRITVKNTGNVDVENVKVEDDMPDYFKTSDDTDFKIKLLKAGKDEEFIIVAKVDEKNLPKSDICVVNEAKLKYENKSRASDTATVCIESDVLGVKKLPETGPVGAKELALTLIALGMGVMGIGVRKLV